MEGGELVARVRSGDREAMGELYADFADRIYGFCVTLLRDRDEAADATQDTFVLAFQRIDQLRDPERLTSWMFAIARHVCFDQLGRRNRVKVVEAVPDFASGDDDPAAAVLALEASALVQAAAFKALRGKKEFRKVLLKDRAILRHLKPREIEEAMDLKHCLRHVDQIFRRVFRKKR